MAVIMVIIMAVIVVVIVTLLLRWWPWSFHYWNGGCWLTQVKLNPNVIVCFKCTPQSLIDIIMITVWCNHLCFHKKKVSSSLIIVLVNIESTKAGIRKKGRGMTLSFFKCVISERCNEKWKYRSPKPTQLPQEQTVNSLSQEWTLLMVASPTTAISQITKERFQIHATNVILHQIAYELWGDI